MKWGSCVRGVVEVGTAVFACLPSWSVVKPTLHTGIHMQRGVNIPGGEQGEGGHPGAEKARPISGAAPSHYAPVKITSG